MNKVYKMKINKMKFLEMHLSKINLRGRSMTKRWKIFGEVKGKLP
jgi:hypothetical protein